MATIKKSPERIQAEKEICALMDAFDKSGYNSSTYKELFETMSDGEFKRYMKDIVEEETYIQFEVDTFGDKITLDKIFDVCESIGFRTHKYVMYRENESADGSICSITPHPALILYLPVKRLQQMVSKKNAASGNIDKINPMTGTVTSDSKSAGINDTQTFGLITTGQKNTIKELLGPRADDEVSKKQMLHLIEERGDVSLKDLHIVPKNKQALQTMSVFLRGVGIEVDVK